jgi:hypothetical protein
MSIFQRTSVADGSASGVIGCRLLGELQIRQISVVNGKQTSFVGDVRFPGRVDDEHSLASYEHNSVSRLDVQMCSTLKFQLSVVSMLDFILCGLCPVGKHSRPDTTFD